MLGVDKTIQLERSKNVVGIEVDVTRARHVEKCIPHQLGPEDTAAPISTSTFEGDRSVPLCNSNGQRRREFVDHRPIISKPHRC